MAAFGSTGRPVHSVLMLLRPKAHASDQTGLFELPGPDGRPYLVFRYTVVRVWEESVAGLLAGVGLAPLALLTNEAAVDLPSAFGRLDARLQAPDIEPEVRKAMLAWTEVLGGLRYTEARIEELFMPLHEILKDSTTYQRILRIGRAEERIQVLQRTLLRQATKRFGPPPAGADAAVRAVADPGRLEHLLDRVLDAAGWDDLLVTS